MKGAMALTLKHAVRSPRADWQIEVVHNEYGYQVVVRNGYGIAVDEATRGNHLRSALRTAEPGSPEALPLPTIRDMALEQAEDLRQQYQVESARVKELPPSFEV